MLGLRNIGSRLVAVNSHGHIAFAVRVVRLGGPSYRYRLLLLLESLPGYVFAVEW